MTTQFDVAVIGGGIAGMIAALRAAEAGRKVLVLEKSADERYVCATRVTGGVFHVALKDVQTDASELEDTIMKATSGTARPALARAIAQDAKRVVNWLQVHGIRFIRGSPDPWHSHVLAPPALQRQGLEWEGRAGDVLLRTLSTALKQSGGQIRLGARAEQLVMEGARCVGVAGSDADGRFEIRSSNVLIADGGFQSAPELLAEISLAPEKLLQRNVGTGKGEGLRMALAAGAAATALTGFYGHLHARAAIDNDKLWPYPWWDDVATAGILVGPDGRRFADEGLGGTALANKVAALPDPLSAMVIFDEAIWQTGGKARFFPPNPHVEKAGGTVLRASSIEELARLSSLPVDALVAEVKSYNAAVDAGAAASLAPSRSQAKAKAQPIRQPPFYAAPVCAGITYTMGGIAIDEFSRVLRPDGTVLAGLYAAGASVGGIEGGENAGYVGGLVKGSVTGFRAAEHMTGILPNHAAAARSIGQSSTAS